MMHLECWSNVLRDPLLSTDEMTQATFIRKVIGTLMFDHFLRNWIQPYLISNFIKILKKKSTDQVDNFMAGLEYQPTNVIGQKMPS